MGGYSLVVCVFLSALCHVIQAQEVIDNYGNMTFACTRLGAVCYGDGSLCNTNTSECICGPDHYGYNCGLDSASYNTSCDTADYCANGGTCYRNAQDTLCYCTPDTYGPQCELKRVTLACNTTGMIINIYPTVSDFQGWIHVEHWYNDTDVCTARNATNPARRYRGYEMVIPYYECGGAKLTQDEQGRDVLSFRVFVRYDNIIFDSVDQIYNFQCLQIPAQGTLNTTAGGYGSVRNSSGLESGTLRETLNPILLEVLDVYGRAVNGPQPIGALITLRFTLIPGISYQAFRIESVIATNGVSGNQHLRFPLVDYGCGSPRAINSGILRSFSGDPTSVLEITFKAFKFLYSYNIEFENSVKLCQNPSNCNITVCAAGNNFISGLGRRKRDLEEEESDKNSRFESLPATLFVWYPTSSDQQYPSADEFANNLRPIVVREAESAPPAPGNANIKECSDTKWLTIVFGALSLCLLTISVILLWAVFCNRKGVTITNTKE